MPGGTEGSAGTLGGTGTAVSLHSTHRQEAIALLRFQLRSLIDAGEKGGGLGAPNQLELSNPPSISGPAGRSGVIERARASSPGLPSRPGSPIRQFRRLIPTPCIRFWLDRRVRLRPRLNWKSSSSKSPVSVLVPQDDDHVRQGERHAVIARSGSLFPKDAPPRWSNRDRMTPPNGNYFNIGREFGAHPGAVSGLDFGRKRTRDLPVQESSTANRSSHRRKSAVDRRLAASGEPAGSFISG